MVWLRSSSRGAGLRRPALPRGLLASRWLRPAVALSILLALGGASIRGTGGTLSVQITSPHGRTGLPGAVRIVAQVRAEGGRKVGAVRFFVDGTLLKQVEDGPPYAVEWTDENPFEARRIAVEAQDDAGNAARDEIVLDPFELTEVTEVTSVLLEAGVYDKSGQFIQGLQPAQFRLVEDSAPQEIQLVRQEQVPATFALLVDSSQSMSRRFDFVQEAAATLAGYLRPKDAIVVAPFARKIGALTGPTNDRTTVIEAIHAIAPQGGTAIFDSVIELTKRLQGGDRRLSIILITDGYDEHSASSADDALQAVKDAQVTVYVVEIGGVAGVSSKGQDSLTRLAEQTGGRVFSPPREQDLVTVYDRLAADAQNRYLLTYTPANQRRDGTWRAISLTTTDPHVAKIRTRDGYFAPKPPPVRPIIEFTASDPDEQYVEVTREDLVVVEDGVEQKVEAFEEASGPVSIILALDASGSMLKATPAVIEAAHGFVKSLRAEDPLGVMLFADQAVLAHDLTTERGPTLETIGRYSAANGTALYDALIDSMQRLKQVDTRRAVVVMTDGRDEDNAGTHPGSTHTLNDVLASIRESGATVFPIGIGLNIDRGVLEQIGRASGGRASFPADVTTLPAQYRMILENLRRRYNISYTSSNLARDGKWRAVEIKTRSPKVTIRSAGGYFAPGQ